MKRYRKLIEDEKQFAIGKFAKDLLEVRDAIRMAMENFDKEKLAAMDDMDAMVALAALGMPGWTPWLLCMLWTPWLLWMLWMPWLLWLLLSTPGRHGNH